MVSEEDQIAYIMRLVEQEKRTSKTQGWEALFAIAVTAVLGYMTFGTGWIAALFGWLGYAIVGTRNGLDAKIRSTERQRAVAYYDGDMEALQDRLKVGF